MADLVNLSDGSELSRERCEARVPVSALRPFLRAGNWAARFGPITDDRMVMDFTYDFDDPGAAKLRELHAYQAREIYRRAPPSSVIDEARGVLSAELKQPASPEEVTLPLLANPV